MIHRCFYFGSYTVVIYSLELLQSCHTFTSGSYTIVHSDSYTVLFYGPYVVYHFILRFLHHLSFHFMILTPFILLFYGSYTVCHLVLQFLYHCHCFRFLYHCHYSQVLHQFFMPIMSYLASVLIPMTFEFSYPELYHYNFPSRNAYWSSPLSNVSTKRFSKGFPQQAHS